MRGGTGGSLGPEGLLTNVCEMAGFLAVAADFSGSWAQVTKVLLFAIPEKNRICFQVFQGVLGGLCWRAQMQYNGTVLQKQRLPTACLFVEPFQMIGFD